MVIVNTNVGQASGQRDEVQDCVASETCKFSVLVALCLLVALHPGSLKDTPILGADAASQHPPSLLGIDAWLTGRQGPLRRGPSLPDMVIPRPSW